MVWSAAVWPGTLQRAVVYNFSGRQEGILSHDDVHIPENLRY